MKALRWHNKHQVSVDEVPDPTLEDPRDVIIRVTSSAICGSDLHLYDGLIHPMPPGGQILGHEPMGEVVEVGSEVKKLKVGDRIVVPFTISCGECWFCQQQLYACCDTTNRTPELMEKLYGYATAGFYGYSALTGAYQGSQAQYLRVPHADVDHIKVSESLPDEKVLFLSDVFPTGWMAAENCNIRPGDVVAIWGAGPVGQFAIRSAFLMGAGRVICIDNIPERLEMAAQAGAETINFQEDDDKNLFDQLKDMTQGRGPDSCMDAVGMEAHGTSPGEIFDWIKMGLRLQMDRPNVLRQCIQACRKAGTVSMPGVYAGFVDKIPLGALMNKGLTLKTGQTHTQKYMEPLLKLIEEGKIDPSFVITHEIPLEAAPDGYETFKQHDDGCIKVVLKPWETKTRGKVRAFASEHKPIGEDDPRAPYLHSGIAPTDNKDHTPLSRKL